MAVNIPKVTDFSSAERAVQALKRAVEALQGGGPAGQRWELIQRQTLSAATDLILFEGLNGNKDQEYLIRGRLLDTTSTNGYYELLFNGSSGSSAIVLEVGSVSVTNNLRSELRICRGSTSNITLFFEGTIVAPTGQQRLYQGHAGLDGTVAQFVHGAWDDTSDNITSLSVQRSASTMAAGSWVELYRRAV